MSIEDANMWHQKSTAEDAEANFLKILQVYSQANLNLDLVLVLLPYKGLVDKKVFF